LFVVEQESEFGVSFLGKEVYTEFLSAFSVVGEVDLVLSDVLRVDYASYHLSIGVKLRSTAFAPSNSRKYRRNLYVRYRRFYGFWCVVDRS